MALFVRAIAEETRNWRLFKLCLTRALTGYSGAMPRCTGRSLDDVSSLPRFDFEEVSTVRTLTPDQFVRFQCAVQALVELFLNI